MNPAQHAFALAIRLYRLVISPAKTVLFGPIGRCRYAPTCSEYALEAVQQHGAWRGGCTRSVLSCGRLASPT